MSRKKECLLVTELLPLYLENQTGKYSNEYIEMHIKTCKECRMNMQYMSDSYGIHKKIEKTYNHKLIFKKAKKRILVGYCVIMVIVWIFIFICLL